MPTCLSTASRKKKIEILFPFCGDRLGGSHLSTIELIKHLDKRTFNVSVVCLRDGKLAPFLAAQGVPCQTLDFSKRLRNFIFRKIQMGFDFISAVRLCRQHRSCIVHCNELYIKLLFAVPGRILCKNIWHQRTMVTANKLRWLMPFLCDKIICVSQSVYETLSPRGKAKAVVIYNPVSVAPPKSRQATQRLPFQGCLVGLASRIVPQKGIEAFVRGASNVLRQKRRTKPWFIIAGNGAMQKKVSGLIKKQPRIQIIPFYHPVESFIRQCRILVAPSLEEGFGRTLVEAMLCGVPVLASDIPAHREISQNGTYAKLVKPGCAVSLATGIANLIRERPSQENLLRARKFAQSKFSPARHVQIMQGVYQDLLIH